MNRQLAGPVIAGALVAIGIAGAGAAVGRGLVDARTGDRSVTVRGLSEKEVKADVALFPLRFSRSGDNLGEVQGQVEGDLATVRKFLAAQGFAASEVDLGRLEVSDQSNVEVSPSGRRPPRYRVSQSVIVRTHDVDRVQATTRKLDQLVREGIVLQDYGGPAYLFTRLNSVRPAMIAEATASARSGAAQFARDSHSNLGPISQAVQGSFEIVGRDELGYGREGGEESAQVFKKVRVVTTVTYRLR
jgi:hypothetical protein